MRSAYIISTGTELMLGSTIDSNSVFISQRLTELGFKVVGKCIVGDSEQYIRNAFRQGIVMADLIISSGGLGPTLDDLTKEVACQELGLELMLRDEEERRLREFFENRRREMPEANLKQAMFPAGAQTLMNKVGTAPGMYLEQEGKTIILLPGPPREMEKMFIDEALPLLKSRFNTQVRVVRKSIKVLGPGESQVEAMIGDIMGQYDNVSLALLAKDGEVHVKISAEGEDYEQIRTLIDEVATRLEEQLGDHIFGYDEESLEDNVAKLLKGQGLNISVAESCTGGLLSKMLTDCPGSSQYFWGSVCTYSNESKSRVIYVPPELIETKGAVSSETAVAMARGVRALSGSEYSLATTGLAGPDGGTPEKPVGLVYICLDGQEVSQVKELRFVGSRDAIRILSAKSALDLLRRHLSGGGTRK